MTTIPLASVPIVGMKHYVSESFHHKFHAGDILELQREPGNSYDALAVEVFWKSSENGGLHKVGYVGRPLNQAIFNLLEAGYAVEAHIRADAASIMEITMEGIDRSP